MNKSLNKFIEQDFRDRITKIINEYPNSEKELAKELNVSQGTINRWKNQKLLPKVDLLAKLSIITNLSLNYIIFGQE
ncbi:multiprotein-bridging factor 1 family protein [Rickettsiales bacterium LUAb2]